MRIFRSALLIGALFVGGARLVCGQTPAGAKTGVAAVVAAAYTSAAAQFPCELKSTGKPKMLLWQGITECLNGANDRVDWDGVSRELQKIRDEYRLSANEIISATESALTDQALPYNKVFSVKEKNRKALLPLSSSLLKFLPDGSLEGLPVFEKKGRRVGVFSGTYAFERAGEVTGNMSRRKLFQYTAPNGEVQPAAEKLLLDGFGVPWDEAAAQPGFRLSADRIVIKR